MLNFGASKHRVRGAQAPAPLDPLVDLVTLHKT